MQISKIQKKFLRIPNVEKAIISAPGKGSIIICRGEASFIAHTTEANAVLSPKEKRKIVQKLKRRFRTTLTDTEAASARTFGDLVDLFTSKVPRPLPLRNY